MKEGARKAVLLLLNLWGRWTGNHAQEDLAKFGYRSERKVKNKKGFLLYFGYCINMATKSDYKSERKVEISRIPPLLWLLSKIWWPNLAISHRGKWKFRHRIPLLLWLLSTKIGRPNLAIIHRGKISRFPLLLWLLSKYGDFRSFALNLFKRITIQPFFSFSLVTKEI